jgi:hypothetical protein
MENLFSSMMVQDRMDNLPNYQQVIVFGSKTAVQPTKKSIILRENNTFFISWVVSTIRFSTTGRFVYLPAP